MMHAVVRLLRACLEQVVKLLIVSEDFLNRQHKFLLVPGVAESSQPFFTEGWDCDLKRATAWAYGTSSPARAAAAALRKGPVNIRLVGGGAAACARAKVF